MGSSYGTPMQTWPPTFRIINPASGKVLALSTASDQPHDVHLADSDPGDYLQFWTRKKGNIIHFSTSLLLTYCNDANIRVESYQHNNPKQGWTYYPECGILACGGRTIGAVLQKAQNEICMKNEDLGSRARDIYHLENIRRIDRTNGSQQWQIVPADPNEAKREEPKKPS